jgi:signal transduction histidine kinase
MVLIGLSGIPVEIWTCLPDRQVSVELVTDLDRNIGMHEILRLDIGRVLLNVFNNAFYAVAEKSRQSLNGYQPKVTLTTKYIRSYKGKPGAVDIAISDNGSGISKKIIDKIFQPFFTTKPTGLETGLGLSLSYDIIKTQEGKIKVDSI